MTPTLPVIVGEGITRKTVMTEFLLVDCPGHLNAILGRPFLFKEKAVISMYHLSMKFPIKDEVGKVTRDQAAARKSYAESVKNHDVTVIDPREPKNKERARPAKEVEEVLIKEGEMSKLVKVGKNLALTLRDELITLLKEYMDVFAWSYKEMP